jgi:hypothetical protein
MRLVAPVARRKSQRRIGYRRVYLNEYPGDNSHPRSLFMADTGVSPVLDRWLPMLTSRNLERTLKDIVAQNPTMRVRPMSDAPASSPRRPPCSGRFEALGGCGTPSP